MNSPTVTYTDEHIGLLRDVRALIEDPDRWCKGHIAEDTLGNPTDEDDPKACRWCVTGAFLHVGKKARIAWVTEDKRFNETVYGQTWDALNKQDSAVYVNDTEGHDAVLALIDEAIERLEGSKNAGE